MVSLRLIHIRMEIFTLPKENNITIRAVIGITGSGLNFHTEGVIYEMGASGRGLLMYITH